METSFWHDKWEKGNIAFHEGEVNPLLAKYFKKLQLIQGDTVFLPLCGKTRDIAWLLAKNYQVIGVELSKLAVSQLFEELGVEPEITKHGHLDRYSAKNITVFVGDIFNLSAAMLDGVKAIYDRGALVALPAETRERYTTHLLDISHQTPQLVICYEYDQTLMQGPPFSITSEQIRYYYEQSYYLTQLESKDDDLQGRVAATETIWLLGPVKT